MAEATIDAVTAKAVMKVVVAFELAMSKRATMKTGATEAVTIKSTVMTETLFETNAMAVKGGFVERGTVMTNCIRIGICYGVCCGK